VGGTRYHRAIVAACGNGQMLLPEAFQHLRHLLEARMGNRPARVRPMEARDERRLLKLQRDLRR
jgi:hypothetical protein